MEGADQSVSAGIGGFIAFFLLALALWFLTRSMNGHLRNLAYREEREEREELERRQAAEQAEAEGDTADRSYVATRPGYTEVAGEAESPGAQRAAAVVDGGVPLASAGQRPSRGESHDETGRTDVGGEGQHRQ